MSHATGNMQNATEDTDKGDMPEGGEQASPIDAVSMLSPPLGAEVAFPPGTHLQGCRVALYSHDTMGLGHTRRNLLIAQALSRPPVQASTLLIAGSQRVGAFEMPPGVDCLTLPALHKNVNGEYRPRRLAVSLQALIELRAQSILAALAAFKPDVLIVDKVPRGALGELDPALEYLRQRGRTRCILGLREVLDDPATVQREWRRAANNAAIRAYYDAIWVYGDPAVYDMAQEYQFPADIAAKIRYTGYLDQRVRLQFGGEESGHMPAGFDLPDGRFVLCVVGGGQDGARLAEAFAQAQLPPHTDGIILTGPYMSAEAQRRLRRYVATNPRMRVLTFVPEPTALVRRAERVVAMGGYNSVCELLSFNKPALVVPRVEPRREQLLRAERLQSLGVLDMLHPDALTPAALSEWLNRDLRVARQISGVIDMYGLERLPYLLEEVLMTRSYVLWSQQQRSVQHVV